MRVLRVLLLGPLALIYCALYGLWAVLEISYRDTEYGWRRRRARRQMMHDSLWDYARSRYGGNESKGDG